MIHKCQHKVDRERSDLFIDIRFVEKDESEELVPLHHSNNK